MTSVEREAFTKILCCIHTAFFIEDGVIVDEVKTKDLETEINNHLKDHGLSYRFTYGSALEHAKFTEGE